MCTAETTNSISTGLTVAGTISQMRAAKAQAEYQARIAESNAAIATKQAENVLAQGADEEHQLRMRTRALAASQNVAMSANGLDTAAGSSLSVLSDTAYLGELDAQTSRYNTAQKVWAYRSQATDYRNQASYARAAGSNAAKSVLLTGITSLAKQYSTYSNGTQKQKTTTYQSPWGYIGRGGIGGE